MITKPVKLANLINVKWIKLYFFYYNHLKFRSHIRFSLYGVKEEFISNLRLVESENRDYYIISVSSNNKIKDPFDYLLLTFEMKSFENTIVEFNDVLYKIIFIKNGISYKDSIILVTI